MELIHDEISLRVLDTARELVRQKGAANITVRDIINAMGQTNRVFYNRFHNLNEVLNILYEETVTRVRESLTVPWRPDRDFGEHILEVALRTLTLTYETRRNMNPFAFEADSAADANFSWWSVEIAKLIGAGKQVGYLRADLDAEAIGYSMWCFIRGFGADALSRGLPLAEASQQFETGLRCFLQGMKA